MVFDGHSDILTDVTIKRLAGERDIIRKYHYDRLRAGNICGACFAIWIDPPYDGNPAKRLAQILKTTRAELIDCGDIVSVVRNGAELKEAVKKEIFAVLLGMEGLSAIGGDLDLLYYLYDFGIRSCMLTWNELNALASGALCDNSTGLTDLGKKSVRLIQNKSMLLDVSHLNDHSFWDVMNISTAPVLASHSNARALCGVARNLSDEQLLAIRDTDGLVGLNAYHLFVSEKVKNQTIDSFIDHAKYIANKIGYRHLGFGFDFFEFFPEPINNGTDNWLHGLESCAKIPALLNKMKKAGFTEPEIDMISYGNWQRMMDKCLKN